VPTGLRADIEDFLSYRRIAMVGVSRNPSDFSRALYRELRSRGYEVVPVNPNVDEVDGDRCFRRIAEVAPPVEGALLMTSGAATDAVVEECATANIPRVWMYRGTGHGAVTPTAVSFCREHHITVIPGECPFMYLAGAGWVHSAHRFCRKMMGKFPM
jgi:predicted CoA-binding protein